TAPLPVPDIGLIVAHGIGFPVTVHAHPAGDTLMVTLTNAFGSLPTLTAFFAGSLSNVAWHVPPAAVGAGVVPAPGAGVALGPGAGGVPAGGVVPVVP